MSYSVREAGVEDAEAAGELVSALRAYACSLDWRLHRISDAGRDAAPEEIREDVEHADRRVLLVEHRNHGIIGVLKGAVHENPKRVPHTTGSLSRLYVRPEFRRRGLGRMLVARMCAWFEERGVEAVTLRYVLADHQSAAFWHAIGFQPVISTARCALDSIRA